MDAKVQGIISNYFKSKPVEKAWVFGSFSRGEETRDSDVDILVVLTPGAHMGLQFFGMIIGMIQNLLASKNFSAIAGNAT